MGANLFILIENLGPHLELETPRREVNVVSLSSRQGQGACTSMHTSWVRTNNFGQKLRTHSASPCPSRGRLPYRAEMVYDLLPREALVKLDELWTNSPRISNVIPCFLSIKMYWYAIFIFHSSPTPVFQCSNGAAFNFTLLSCSN